MGINVLSLFDGISCGRVALERAGLEVDKYFASEIDKHAIKVSSTNWPETIHVGDVTKLSTNSLPKIDLLIAGRVSWKSSNLTKSVNSANTQR